MPLRFLLTTVDSFGQYVYGIYLGFNGEILLKVCSFFYTSAHWSTKSPTFSYSHRAATISAAAPVYGLHPHAAWVQRRKARFGGVFWFIAVVHNEYLEYSMDRNSCQVVAGPHFLSLKYATFFR